MRKMAYQKPVETEKRAPPVAKFVAGGVKASVWHNTNKEGQEFFNVTIEKSYTPDGGKTWATSESYMPSELAKLQLVLSQAYAFCVQKSKAE
jgi:hypothetical protein